MAARKLLVTGATGKQGGALIDALLSTPNSNISLYGLTRNAASPAATKLAARNVKIIEGDPTDPNPIFAQTGPGISSVFSVTVPGKTEEAQAIPLIDAALAHGVQHFIFTSVDRGGPMKSESDDPTPVPHFITKYNVEQHLKRVTAASTAAHKMTYTILRPVAFFDNLTPDLLGKSFAQMMKQLNGQKIAFIGTKDIGRVAGHIAMHPDQYDGKAVSLAADSLDFETMNKIFKEEVGTDLPLVPGVLASFIKWALADLGKMFQWFKEGGYAYDIKMVRMGAVDMQDFRTWLRTSSKFEMKK